MVSSSLGAGAVAAWLVWTFRAPLFVRRRMLRNSLKSFAKRLISKWFTARTQHAYTVQSGNENDAPRETRAVGLPACISELFTEAPGGRVQRKF